jgi:hypothetical protein
VRWLAFRAVTGWGSSVRALVVGAALLAACSSDDPDAAPSTTTTAEPASTTTSTTSTTAPERPTSTTTTAFDPASVEGQVEAAYLRSWDVYAEAVYNLELDEEALASTFDEDHLITKRTEIEKRIAEGRAAFVSVEHDYSIQLSDPTTAFVIDQYVNHQVLIDPVTRRPIEEDPNETLVDAVTLKLRDGSWRVTRKERL